MKLRIRLVSAALVALASTTAAAAGGGGGLVSASGVVGRLRIDRSAPAAVEAFAGPPAFARTGRADPSLPRYKALGYGCSRSLVAGRRDPMLAGPRSAPHSNVYCQTIYYVDLETGKLAAFYTTAAGFETAARTRVGTSQAEAARRERSRPLAGCALQILVRARSASLSIQLAGGKVVAFELESKANPVGLQFC